MPKSGAAQDTVTGSAVADSRTVVRQGKLTKCGGGIKTWHERFFRLFDDGLFVYSESEKNVQKEKGSFSVRGATIREPETSYGKKKQHCIEIVTPERVYAVHGKSAEEKKQWMLYLTAISQGKAVINVEEVAGAGAKEPSPVSTPSRPRPSRRRRPATREAFDSTAEQQQQQAVATGSSPSSSSSSKQAAATAC